MQIDDIKQMSREHLEDLVEYMIKQKETHINVAPHGWDRVEKTAWVKGFDYSRARLIKMAEDHELLKSHLPEKNYVSSSVDNAWCLEELSKLEAENARLKQREAELERVLALLLEDVDCSDYGEVGIDNPSPATHEPGMLCPVCVARAALAKGGE